MTTTFDPLVFGRRLHHLRRRAGLTLSQLGEVVGRPASYLSQLENGHREPRISMVEQLAAALGCSAAELLDAEPPSRRAALEVAATRLQDHPRYRALQLPFIRPSSADDAVLETIVGLFEALEQDLPGRDRPPGPGRGARAANAALREEMRRRDNHFPEVEAVADGALEAVGYTGSGALPERTLIDVAAHFGFTVARVLDLPSSTRSITDVRRRIVYVPQRNSATTRTVRSVIAQTLGHFALGHGDPADFEDYVRQRVEANYFAGALLAPERAAVPFLSEARTRRDLSVEDLKEVFYISYEMAAHRLTNLITRHLGIPVHFLRSDPEGVLWKAYENDGVPLPADDDGTIEGQRVCRWWGARQAFGSEDSYALHHQFTETPNGTFWCVTQIEAGGRQGDGVTIGTTADHAAWFRGGDTTRRTESRCPDPTCCRRPSPSAVRRWEGAAWPSARDHSHFVSGLPTDTVSFNPFPGVDLTDVYNFLDGRSLQS